MSFRMSVLLSGSLVLLAMGSGCTWLKPDTRAATAEEVPERFRLASMEGKPSEEWWSDFGSRQLDDLVVQALDQNLTMKQWWARLDQAGASVTVAGSGFFPQIGYDGNVAWSRTTTTTEVDSPGFAARVRSRALNTIQEGVLNTINNQLGGGTAIGGGGNTGGSQNQSNLIGGGGGSTSATTAGRRTREGRTFGLSLAASYELDVWGRIASAYRATQFEYDATREDVESTAMTLAAEVADRWLRILEQEELRRILDEQLKTNRTYLELVELRFRKGQVSALDVYQQRQAVSQVEQQIPLVESAAAVLRHDLAVLLGVPPQTPLDLGTYDLSTVPPPPATGVPSDLLLRRPDLRAALARLESAGFQVAAARADVLPAFRLNGGLGFNTSTIRFLLDDWFLSIASGLSGPLFDGFRRQAEIDRAMAILDERLASYRLVILTAIREVEDALIQERKQREHLEALAKQAEEASNALREAGSRYQKGLNDYLPVLAALERTQALARSLVSARREALVYRINLYRALGGTWTNSLISPATRPAPQEVAQGTEGNHATAVR